MIYYSRLKKKSRLHNVFGQLFGCTLFPNSAKGVVLYYVKTSSKKKALVSYKEFSGTRKLCVQYPNDGSVLMKIASSNVRNEIGSSRMT